MVSECSDASYAHLFGWKGVVERAYANPCYNFECWGKPGLVGILPMVHLKSRLFGNHFVSMPYLDCGGPLFTDPGACQSLLAEATSKAGALGASVCVRSMREGILDWKAQTEKVTMHLSLQSDPEAMLKKFSSERRNRIKKAAKNGLTVSFQREEGLDVFYRIFSENMRDLGSPVHSKRFFREILATFQRETGVVIVNDPKGDSIGAGLFLRFKELLALPWVSCLRHTFKLNPNIILYWELIKRGCETGAMTFDFGRSTKGSGTFEYKRQWGAEPVPLFWYQQPCSDLNGGSSLDSKSAKNQAMIALWKKLPLCIANGVGPMLRKSISL